MEDKKISERLKGTLTYAIKNPLEACVEMSLYIFCMAMGIWIVGFALSFLIKVMQPIIFLT